MTPDSLIKLAYDSCYENRALLFKSDRCGCYECGVFFSPFEIDSWGCYNNNDDGDQDEGEDHPFDTAECPKCGYEHVVPVSREYELTTELLAAVKKYSDQRQRSNPFACREHAWFIHGVTAEVWAKRWNIEPFTCECECGKVFVTNRPFVSGNLRGLMAEEHGDGCEQSPPYCVVAAEGDILSND